MLLNVDEKRMKGKMRVRGVLLHLSKVEGPSDFRPAVLEVKPSTTHYFYPDRFQCLSRLQGGVYVALGSISSGLKWQPRLVEAPRSGPCGRGRREAAGNRLRSLPGLPEGV